MTSTENKSTWEKLYDLGWPIYLIVIATAGAMIAKITIEMGGN